ncbi:hypothetical protein [Mycobacterium sp. OTB74]|jgi:hypothetical protein|uniref:hypothetical protein n=1 Tax=Mycobacterium sp. OTB74 TaxID=1853452 RepID=UPI00247573DD|nr:hypothetical protein [Mycobacterium sp. OTB74]MDH6245737.1 hypothetical protein [Mycobacterium sp. OTB74]
MSFNVADIVSAPKVCCICREPLTEWPIDAHNPDPVTADGECCPFCNEYVVIPAREAHSGD